MRRAGLPLILFFSISFSLWAATCDRAGCGTTREGNAIVCFTPAWAVSLSDKLRVAGASLLSAEWDVTHFNGVTEYDCRRPWFFGVEVENGLSALGWLAGLSPTLAVNESRRENLCHQAQEVFTRALEIGSPLILLREDGFDPKEASQPFI